MARSNSRRTRRKRVTVHDIAREADVSIGTVSRALNNAYGVDPDTRDRVLALSRRLGVRPRHSSKHLHVGVIVTDRKEVPATGYASALLYEIVHELAERDIAMTVIPDSRAERVNHHIYDGLLSAAWDPRSLPELEKVEHTPIVLLNRFGAGKRFHVVGWDHVAEGRAVAEYFLRQGLKRPAFVAVSGTGLNTYRRLEGFKSACEKAGVPLPPERIEMLESRSLLFAAIKRVVDHQAEGIFLPGQNLFAAEALSILNLMGLKVPEDVSIIGGENPSWSELLNPPLTTIELPLHELAVLAINHLIALIEKKGTKPTEVLLATKIIERKSVRMRASLAATA